MNLTGKILTLLILLMSIFFFAVALMVSAAHVNWKEEAATAKTRAAQVQRSLNETKSATIAQKDFIAREKVARAKQIAALTSRVQEISSELADNKEALRESTQTGQARLVTMQEAVARQKQLDKELESAIQRNAELVEKLGVINASLQNKTKENFDQKNTIETLLVQSRDLSERIALLKRVLDNNGLDENWFLVLETTEIILKSLRVPMTGCVKVTSSTFTEALITSVAAKSLVSETTRRP